jgi:hypothetical protein
MEVLGIVIHAIGDDVIPDSIFCCARLLIVHRLYGCLLEEKKSDK